VFEIVVLRRIFGPQREGVMRGWRRRLHNEDLYKLYASPNISDRMRGDEMAWVCSMHER
jgi:hypothetical protein